MKTGKQLIILMLLIFPFLIKCQTTNKLDSIPKELVQAWTHSHEEDSATVKVYRPQSYKFPLSRGRDGFEFKAKGEFFKYAIAETDGTKIIKGKWKIKDKNTFLIQLENQSEIELKIVTLKPDLLIIQKPLKNR